MQPLGLELSDAGIIAVGAKLKRLIAVDGQALESPGFALAAAGGLLVGNNARSAARLNPTSYTDRFWNDLSPEPLKQPGFQEKNNTEIAYEHLARVWDHMKAFGDEVLIAVPGFFTQKQLGLILGISRELCMPVTGFIAASIAASSKAYPQHHLLHVDIHLHQTEIICLEQTDHIRIKDTQTIPDKGLSHVFSACVRAIADEFVRSTRFDPLDQATHEQQLYDCLPSLMAALQHDPCRPVDIRAGARTHSLTVTRELLAETCKSLCVRVRRLIEENRAGFAPDGLPLVVQLTHRISPLPGLRNELLALPDTRLVQLMPGAAAEGAVQLYERFVSATSSRGVTFITSRRVPADSRVPAESVPDVSLGHRRPTHIVYRGLAYPLAATRPLVIGCGDGPDLGISMTEHDQGIAPRHCTVDSSGRDVVLIAHVHGGTFIDDEAPAKQAILRPGQVLRLGNPGVRLQVIACIETDEA